MIHLNEIVLGLAMVCGFIALVVALRSPRGRTVLIEAGIRVFAALVARLLEWISRSGERSARRSQGSRKDSGSK